jgi:hypothetical protein
MRFSRRWLWRMPSSWIQNPVRTSKKIHYVSATESSRSMLYKIWDFHGGYYGERRLLGYKNPVHTSQETLLLRYRAQPINAMYDLKFQRRWLWRMLSSVMLRLVALIRIDVSEERFASIIRVTRIGELGTTLAVTSNRNTLWRYI